MIRFGQPEKVAEIKELLACFWLDFGTYWNLLCKSALSHHSISIGGGCEVVFVQMASYSLIFCTGQLLTWTGPFSILNTQMDRSIFCTGYKNSSMGEGQIGNDL